jgi:hypothetical protein
MNTTGTARGQDGPLTSVLAAVAAGIPSISALIEATGLPRDVVEAAVDHLSRTDRLATLDLSASCEQAACNRCPLAERPLSISQCTARGPNRRR